MKKMTSTTDNQNNRQAAFVCSTWKDNLLALLEEFLLYRMGLNSKPIEDKNDFTWCSYKYRNSYLSGLKDRDASVEIRLKAINTMVMDYHIHCPIEVHYIVYEFDEEADYVCRCDENPAESKALLLKAKSYMEVILPAVFKEAQPTNREYSILAVSLMLHIYDELTHYDMEINPVKEIRKLLQENI